MRLWVGHLTSLSLRFCKSPALVTHAWIPRGSLTRPLFMFISEAEVPRVEAATLPTSLSPSSNFSPRSRQGGSGLRVVATGSTGVQGAGVVDLVHPRRLGAHRGAQHTCPPRW